MAKQKDGVKVLKKVWRFGVAAIGFKNNFEKTVILL